MNGPSAAVIDRLVPTTRCSPRAGRGLAWLDDHGFPTSRDEAWRYTPVDEIMAALAGALPASPTSPPLHRAQVDTLAGAHQGHRLVFVNGVYDRHTSDDGPHVAGLWLRNRSSSEARTDPTDPIGEVPVDGFDALNWSAGVDVAAVFADADIVEGEPIHVVHVASPGGGVTVNHPRTLIIARPGSRLHVIESFVGLPGASITNASTRIIAGESSSIRYQRIQQEQPDAIHIGRTSIDQAADSTVRATSVMTGARIARSAFGVALNGPGAAAELEGLYLPSAHQRHDNVITVDHRASACTSSQRFNGIIDGHGRGSFSGHVIVRPATTGTNASQTNRNLVLTPSARADTRPWLEIFSDDVRCTHGATVGHLDDASLFYLRSRGIPLDEARAMLVAAFAGEIIDGISPVWLRDRISTAFTPGDGT